MAQDPVCHIPPVVSTPSKGPVSMPSIPPAQPNLASLTATVNALRNAFLIASGQMTPANGPNRTPDGSGSKSGSWTQKDIQTEKVKIYQNNDPTTGVFVEVQRVNSLTMLNKQTGQTWQFNRPPDTSGS